MEERKFFWTLLVCLAGDLLFLTAAILFTAAERSPLNLAALALSAAALIVGGVCLAVFLRKRKRGG